MVEHNEEGAFGVVLNRPSETTVAEVVPALSDLRRRRGAGADRRAGRHRLRGRSLGEFDDPEASAEAGRRRPRRDRSRRPRRGAARARVYAGHSGWGPGQLEDELERDAWIVEPASPEDPFRDDDIWSMALRAPRRRVRAAGDDARRPVDELAPAAGIGAGTHSAGSLTGSSPPNSAATRIACSCRRAPLDQRPQLREVEQHRGSWCDLEVGGVQLLAVRRPGGDQLVDVVELGGQRGEVGASRGLAAALEAHVELRATGQKSHRGDAGSRHPGSPRERRAQLARRWSPPSGRSGAAPAGRRCSPQRSASSTATRCSGSAGNSGGSGAQLLERPGDLERALHPAAVDLHRRHRPAAEAVAPAAAPAASRAGCRRSRLDALVAEHQPGCPRRVGDRDRVERRLHRLPPYRGQAVGCASVREPSRHPHPLLRARELAAGPDRAVPPLVRGRRATRCRWPTR